MKVTDLISVLKELPLDSDIIFTQNSSHFVFSYAEVKNEIFFSEFDEEGKPLKKKEIDVQKPSSYIHIE